MWSQWWARPSPRGPGWRTRSACARAYAEASTTERWSNAIGALRVQRDRLGQPCAAPVPRRHRCAVSPFSGPCSRWRYCSPARNAIPGTVGDGGRRVQAGVSPSGWLAASDRDGCVLADEAGPRHAYGDRHARAKVALERPDSTGTERALSQPAARASATDAISEQAARRRPRAGVLSHRDRHGEGRPGASAPARRLPHRRARSPERTGAAGVGRGVTARPIIAGV
jgi:hypothetical protein